MPAFVLFTRLPAEAVSDPRGFRAKAQRVSAAVRQIPGVRWLSSYAVLGPHDIVDVFEAPDDETATRVALTIRRLADVSTETYPAIPWDDFLNLLDRVAEGS